MTRLISILPRRMTIPGTVLVLLLTCIACLPAPAQQISGDDLYAWVEGISGKDAEGRRNFVRSELRSLRISFEELAFDTSVTRQGKEREISGINLVSRIGTGKPIIVVGAHYDAVPGSPGSNDNGAGVAVLLGLLAELKDHDLPVTLEICFFDQEEVGLIGSAVYVRDHAHHEDHRAMINLDVVGFGTEIFAGPVGEGDDDLVLRHVHDAADAMGETVLAMPLYPPSDHISFARAGLENIAISIVPEGDAERVNEMLGGKRPTEETLPIVLRTMHTPKDGMDTIETDAMMTILTLVKGVIERLSGV